jgi:hypothetical protein
MDRSPQKCPPAISMLEPCNRPMAGIAGVCRLKGMASNCAALLATAVALTFCTTPAFAQRAGSHGGGGGGAHASSGLGGHSLGGHAGLASRSVAGGWHASGVASSARPAPPALPRSEATSAGSSVGQGIAVGSSGDTSAGKQTRPGRDGEEATASRGLRSAEHWTNSRHVTLGFPPQSFQESEVSAATLRHSGVVISGQTKYLWADPPAHKQRVNDLGSAQELEFMKSSGVKDEARKPERHRIVPMPPHRFEPRHRRRHEPIFGGSGLFPGGFGVPFFGFPLIPDCGLLWEGTPGLNCAQFGYWDGEAGGLADGYEKNYANGNQEESQEGVESQEVNPGTYEAPPGSSTDEDQDARPEPLAVLWMNGGTSFAVADYWLADGRLHYLTSYGGENSVAMDELDLQKTVDANANRGVEFVLRPGPKPGLPDHPQPR